MKTFNLINQTITENYTSGVFDLNDSHRGTFAGTLLFNFSAVVGTKDAVVNVYVTNDDKNPPASTVWFEAGDAEITDLDSQIEFTFNKPYTKFKFEIDLNGVTSARVDGFGAFNTEGRYD
jgi:hypothetical protein